MDEKNFESAAMKGLTEAQRSLMSEGRQKEFEDFQAKILEATPAELEALIPEAAEMSFNEEALAREFVKRGLDATNFLEVAKFRTTKAILRGEM